MRRAPGPALLAVAALALAACGGAPPDLFAIERSGRDPNADVELVVSDGGTVTCDGGEPRRLEAEQLLRARELERELARQADLGLELPPGPGSTLSYRVRLSSGQVAFSDRSRDLPPAFQRLAGFTKNVAEDVCGIER